MKYDKNHALLSTSIPGLPEPARGKVRDVYDLGDSILFVATDRISAYDCIMPDGIPGKGCILTQMSLFWFKLFGDAIPNHLLCADADQYPESLAAVREDLRGRSGCCPSSASSAAIWPAPAGRSTSSHAP